ncbi:hypothetical protein HD806DRAFT_477803 [Xylariaceae sp. AK1471]|nr:hypothetical protein HD806DRAFT_477803 [Xylariaceae sp. AK1471]
MRFHSLVAVSAAVCALANTNKESTQRKIQATANDIRYRDQVPPALAAPGSNPSFHVPPTRRINLQTSHSRRDDDDDDDDSDDDDPDDGKLAYRPRAAAIAGASIGGIVLILILLVLWYWFKVRPRRQKRHRQRRQQDKKYSEDGNYAENQGQGQHLLVTNDNPPRYEQMSVARNVPTAPPHTTMSPVELPSPVDNAVPSVVYPDQQGGYHITRPLNHVVHPVDQPNPTY